MFIVSYAIEICDGIITHVRDSVNVDVQPNLYGSTFFFDDCWKLEIYGPESDSEDSPAIIRVAYLDDRQYLYRAHYALRDCTVFLGIDGGYYASHVLPKPQVDYLAELRRLGITAREAKAPVSDYVSTWSAEDAIYNLTVADTQVVLRHRNATLRHYQVCGVPRWVITAHYELGSDYRCTITLTAETIDDNLIYSLESFLGEHYLNNFCELLDVEPELYLTKPAKEESAAETEEAGSEVAAEPGVLPADSGELRAEATQEQEA